MPGFSDANQPPQYPSKLSRRYNWAISVAVGQDAASMAERQGNCELVILRPHPEAAAVLLSNLQAAKGIRVCGYAPLLLPKICKEFNLNPQITFWYCAELYQNGEIEYSQIHLFLDEGGAVHAQFSRVEQSRMCQVLREFGY